MYANNTAQHNGMGWDSDAKNKGLKWDGMGGEKAVIVCVDRSLLW